MHSDCDGIAYELEPWEQARRQRLQQYDRLRDKLAGIVVYDGEWDENIWQPSETDFCPQTLDESQATAFPEAIDQHPPEWNCVSQATPDGWNQTPLACWVERRNQANTADADIDQSPPQEWEEQQWDQSENIWQDTQLAQWATQQHNWDGIDSIPPEDEPVFIYD